MTSPEYQFSDALASKPQPVPSQWIEAGDVEELNPRHGTTIDTHTTPILVKIGKELKGVWNDNGELIDGPHGERPAARVLYVTPDGSQAHERVIPGKRGSSQESFKPKLFTAAAAPTPQVLEDVPPNKQQLYRNLTAIHNETPSSPEAIISRGENPTTPRSQNS